MSEDGKEGGASPAQKAMPSLDELAAGQAPQSVKETAANDEDKPAKYTPKLDKSGAGFNQFDPVLSATSFFSRRFGLVGGLAVVALLRRMGLAAAECRPTTGSLAHGVDPSLERFA